MRLLPIALVLTTACTDKTADSGGPSDGGATDGTLDTDGDGTPDTFDCAPDDSEIYPGATELCDGVDNDCDGVVDDNAIDATTRYADTDGDGFGDVHDGGTATCEDTDGLVLDKTDCDDSDADVYPDATESCNGVDDDCDGDVDETGADGELTWYFDGDDDGYGDITVTKVTCEVLSGYVSDDSDCDDADPAVNPDGTEVCGDGVDNDCDGTGCALEGTVMSTDADLTVTGTSPKDRMGVAMAAVGDTDGDGFDDLVVGATKAEAAGTTTSGSAYLYLGSASGLDIVPGATMSGEESSDLFGWAVDGAGDSNDDGFADVIVSTYDAGGSGNGAAYLFFGPLTGDTVASDADVVLTPSVDGTSFGWRGLGAGDVDGDGNLDLLVTAPNGSSGRGASYVFSGSLSGSILTTDADATLLGADGLDSAGGAASAPGDLDGDGVDDIAISSRDHTVASRAEGQVYLWFGALSGELDLADSDAILTGIDSGDSFGWEQWGAGDTNGDGYLDFAVSTPNRSSYRGECWLFLGPLSTGTRSASTAEVSIEGLAGFDYFGDAVRGEGDVDGDGYGDLAVTATTGFGGAGAAHLFYGPLTGSYDSSDAAFSVSGATGSDILGASVAINGDYNGDGNDDFAVGAGGAGTYTGAFYLFYAGVL